TQHSGRASLGESHHRSGSHRARQSRTQEAQLRFCWADTSLHLSIQLFKTMQASTSYTCPTPALRRPCRIALGVGCTRCFGRAMAPTEGVRAASRLSCLIGLATMMAASSFALLVLGAVSTAPVLEMEGGMLIPHAIGDVLSSMK